MNIVINYEGLNKILCKIGIHRWCIEPDSPQGNDGDIDYKHPVYKYCLDCDREKRRR